MARAPTQKPMVKIPGISRAKAIQMQVQGRGDSLAFRMFVGKKEVRLDPDSEWMDHSWFGLVVRELDRLKVWHYRTTECDGMTIFDWSTARPKPSPHPTEEGST